MYYVYYKNYRGGVNNLKVATDTKTGECSSSLIDKEHALRALQRKMSRRQNHRIKKEDNQGWR